MFTVSSAKTGIVTTALKSGTGSATMTTAGTYTGTTDLEYVCVIDGIGTGEIGSATFKWSDDGGATWDATTVATDDTPPIALNNGVTVCWVAGAGADFVIGDTWYFKAIQPFSAGKMLDLDRDHRYRSAALGAPNTITVNFGASAQPTTLIINDHNLTNAATISLKADADNISWGAPTYTQAVTWASGKILCYLTTPGNLQYWQLQITDAGNPNGYIEISELYLGTYVELSKTYKEGFSLDNDFILASSETTFGIRRNRFYNSRLSFQYDFRAMTSADVTSMNTLVSAIGNRTTGIFKPFWFNADSAVPTDTWLVTLDSLPVSHNTKARYDMSLKFTEVLRSV